MQQFVLCAIGATMCVLCFAIGFIAAVVLGVADHGGLSNINAPAWLRGPRRSPQATRQETSPDTFRPPAAAPVAAAAPAPVPVPVPAPAPVRPQPWAAPAPPVTVAEPRPTPMAEPIAPLLPAPAPVEHPAASAPESRPGHMVYLFGDPQLEVVGASAVAAPRSASPGPGSNVRPLKPHAPSSRLTGSEIDLLPRHPAHSGDARRRR